MPWSNQGGGGPWQPKSGGPWGNGPQNGGGSGGGNRPPDLEDLLRRGQQRLRQVLPGGGGRSGGFGGLGVAMLVVVAGIFWLLTGFYTVRPNEVGLNLVVGKYRGKTAPGLNYNWPAPIGSVVKVPVTDVNTMQIGRSQGSRDDSLMLTGDERIVDIDFTVFWQVRADAPEKFAFNLKNPQSTIRAVAESAMREVVGRSQLNQIVASAVSQGANSRVQVETDVRTLMQRLLDEYNSGVLVTSINVRPIDVPQQVIDAFRDINNADQEATQVITQAQTYESRVIPEANADAAKILREAEGYREATVSQARGQAGRFAKVYEEYRKAPDVTRERLFLETMERVFAGMDKVIVDQSKGAGVVPYLPLGQLQQPSSAPRLRDREDSPVKSNMLGSALLVVVAVVLFLVWNTFFVVQQTQQALVLRFGQVVNVLTDPGLYAKLPFIDNVISFEKLILEVDVPGPARPQGEEVITADEPTQQGVAGEQRKRLVVDAFARYRISNPLLFYQSVGSVQGAESRLSTVIISAVRRVLGGVRLSDVVREKREQLMTEIRRQVDVEAKNFGIAIVDVRLRRADLPQATSEFVFKSMRAQFVQQATDIRSRGQQKATEVQADTDRRATIIRAEAQQRGDQARGDGEAQRNAIFAEAFGKDPEFFAFYRSMQAYEAGLNRTDTRLVISPDSDFFRYFSDPRGREQPPKAERAPQTTP